MLTGGLVEIVSVELLLYGRQSNEENKFLFWRQEPGEDTIVTTLGERGEGERVKKGRREEGGREGRREGGRGGRESDGMKVG